MMEKSKLSEPYGDKSHVQPDITSEAKMGPVGVGVGGGISKVRPVRRVAHFSM